jgi:U2 small nuclear ribonucleoprotein B''
MNQPNATLYIKNIDWKIKKGLVKRALYALCARHGKVLEIIVLRKEGLRGQAFVIMEHVHAATAARQAEQGFSFFGKDLVIDYAHRKSDRIAQRDGDYVQKAKRQKTEAVVVEQDQQQQQQQQQEEEEEKEDDKEEVQEEAIDAASAAGSAPENVVVLDAAAPPSQILLAQNLPTDCNEMMLGMLFQQYAGYKEVRLPRPGLAFVEFEDEPHATIAMKALNHFKLTPKDTLMLTYGKV